MKKTNKVKVWREYSKNVLIAMIVLWFVVAVFGMVIIVYQMFTTPEYVVVDGLYNYVGLPMTGGIVSYLIKSAVENKQKIKNTPNAELEGIDLPNHQLKKMERR